MMNRFTVDRFAAGALAGLVATVPMTLAMFVLRRTLPTSEENPLPPEEITAELAERAGIPPHRDEDALRLVSLAGHFAFGTAAGALYAPLAPKPDRLPVVRGVAYGLGLWTVNYLGWLPGAGLIPSPTKQPARLAVMMGLAHVVWGGVLGERMDRWTRE